MRRKTGGRRSFFFYFALFRRQKGEVRMSANPVFRFPSFPSLQLGRILRLSFCRANGCFPVRMDSFKCARIARFRPLGRSVANTRFSRIRIDILTLCRWDGLWLGERGCPPAWFPNGGYGSGFLWTGVAPLRIFSYICPSSPLQKPHRRR